METILAALSVAGHILLLLGIGIGVVVAGIALFALCQLIAYVMLETVVGDVVMVVLLLVLLGGLGYGFAETILT
jgi:hypothetical protein